MGEILGIAMGSGDPPTQATLVPLMGTTDSSPSAFPSGTTAY